MSTQGNASPRILSSGWGKMEIEQLGAGKDFKLWPGGGRAWDWSEFGTEHARGIQVDDVKELISHGAEVIILTRGVLSRLKVPSRTKLFIEEKNIKVIVASTKQGVKIYNEYCEKNVPVAGLFHSTC
jgi:hypothetical protein